jgi:YaiO family outer membrane protein
MKYRTTLQQATALALVLAASAASANDVALEYTRSERSRGFGAIDHVTVSYGTSLADKATVQVRLESKRQGASGIAPAKSGAFLEGIFSYPLTESIYGMTRVGLTDERTLFIDRSVYQEFGYKLGKFGNAFVDLNGGIGSRRFPSGTEAFLNVGPTVSWASGAVWLRREQSLDEGGYRNVFSMAQWLSPQLKFDVGLIGENRKKYTLPVAGAVALSRVESTRFSVGATYQMTPKSALTLRAEKVSLEKEGVPGKYYDPLSIGVGVSLGF